MGMRITIEQQQYRHKILKAENLASEGKYLHAIQVFSSLIEEHPEEKESYYKLVAVYEKTDNIDAAHKLLLKLLEENPEDEELRIYLSHFLLRNEKWDETLETLEFLTPEDQPSVAFFNGFAYFKLGNYQLAERSLKKFIKLDKKSEFIPDAYVFLTKTCVHLEKYESALKYIKIAETFFASDPEIQLLFAVVYSHLDMNQHALERINKTLKFKRKPVEVYKWAGIIFYKNKEFDKATNYFNKYLKTSDSDSAEIYFFLGEIAKQEGDLARADEFLEISTKLINQFLLTDVEQISNNILTLNTATSDG